MRNESSIFVHERALCESTDLGPGTRVWAFAHVMKGAVIGADCNICDHAFIETGAVLGDRVTVKNNVLVWDKVTVEDDVFLGPNVVLTNDHIPRVKHKNAPDQFLATLIREGASIGANATVICGVTIGRNAFIGAGAVVVHDVPAHALVVGNPARQLGWMCECGGRLGEELRCPECSRKYEREGEGLQEI